MSSLLNLTQGMEVPINIMCTLFDSCDLPILNYCCEVIGFYKAENMERVQRKFCKWLLNVKMSTNSLSLYSELGRYPLFIERNIRIVKYFLKLYGVKQHNCILNTIIIYQREKIEISEAKNWSSKVLWFS